MPELEPGEAGDALVEDLPRAQAEARPGHDRDPDAEQHEPHEQAGEAGEDDGGRPRAMRERSPGRWYLCHDPHMELTFLGGARTVTGSRHLVDTGRARVLVDCGMFQGGPDESMRNRVPLGVDPATLDAVVLTHAHLDHCGLLPLLVREGFRGAIVCTAATRRARPARAARLGASSRRSSPSARPAASGATRSARPSDDARDETAFEEAVELAAEGAESPGGPDPEELLRAAGPERGAGPRRPALHRGRRRRHAADVPARSRTARSTRSRRASTSRSLDAGPHPGLGDRPDAARAPGRRARHGRRVLGRPRAARDADPPRPDADDRGRHRPVRVHLRRPRARGRRAGDRRRWPRSSTRPSAQERRAADPVVRHRADAGDRVGAGPARWRPGRIPQLPLYLDSPMAKSRVRHLPRPPRGLRRGDRDAAARPRRAARLPGPAHRPERPGVRADRAGARRRT